MATRWTKWAKRKKEEDPEFRKQLSDKHKKWRNANPEKIAAWRRRQLLRKRARKQELIDLLGGKCTRCGLSDIRCLDFDHKDKTTKVAEICSMLPYKSWERVLNEALKCQLLCANCHRIKTFEEQDWKSTEAMIGQTRQKVLANG